VGSGRVRRRALILRLSVIAIVAVAGVLGARSWLDRKPARIEIDRDTLVLYGDGLTRVPYRIVTQRGEEVAWAKPVLAVTDTVLDVGRFALSCRRDGRTDVTVTVDELTARFHAICRTATSIRGTTSVALSPGDPPVPVELWAQLTSGDLVRVKPLEMTVRDTLVARLVDGRIMPVGVGRTYVHVELGGIRASVDVSISETLARDTLELRPGEFRTWPLVVGRYDITVKSLTGARSFAELEMIAERTKCVPSNLDRDMIHCLVKDTTVLALHNRHPTGAPRSPRTAVTVIRTH
jgi:hypothetical protein